MAARAGDRIDDSADGPAWAAWCAGATLATDLIAAWLEQQDRLVVMPAILRRWPSEPRLDEGFLAGLDRAAASAMLALAHHDACIVPPQGGVRRQSMVGADEIRALLPRLGTPRPSELRALLEIALAQDWHWWHMRIGIALGQAARRPGAYVAPPLPALAAKLRDRLAASHGQGGDDLRLPRTDAMAALAVACSLPPLRALAPVAPALASDDEVERFVVELARLAESRRSPSAQHPSRTGVTPKGNIAYGAFELHAVPVQAMRDRLLEMARGRGFNSGTILHEMLPSRPVDPTRSCLGWVLHFPDTAWCRRMVALRVDWQTAHGNEDWSRADPPFLHHLTPPADPQCRLLDLLRGARAASPTAAWRKSAEEVLAGLGEAVVREALIGFCAAAAGTSFTRNLEDWWHLQGYCRLAHRVADRMAAFGTPEDAALASALAGEWLVPDDRTGVLSFLEFPVRHPASVSDEVECVLKGIAWLLSLRPGPAAAEALRRLAATMLRIYPMDAHDLRPMPRSLKAANACILALGAMGDASAVTALARLRLKQRDSRVLATIGKAMAEAAARARLTTDELEDIAVPTHGLDATGARRLELEAATAVLQVAPPGRATLSWYGAGGARLKAAPAALRTVEPALRAAWNELQDAARGAESDLAVQRDRLERSYTTGRSWSLETWRERVLGHPLLGALARHLVWRVETPQGTTQDLLWTPAGPRDQAGRPAADPDGAARIRLWHPLLSSPGEVQGWRAALREAGLVQPFRQAGREIYVLSGFESPAAFSNRFAGHLLRQQQYLALARLRGWRATTRIAADVPNDEPTHLALPAHGLRAEWWVAPAGEECAREGASAAYAFVRTDQLRFRELRDGGDWRRDGGRRLEAGEFVPLGQVPALVLSEVLRDIDLMVGVASIGNDPLWLDGGAKAEHPSQWRRDPAVQDYWMKYAFGPLGAMAEARREALAGILPGLAIATRCRIEGRFLHVAGQAGGYRIHLGSAAVFDATEDRHLPLAVDAAEAARRPAVQLDFEPDAMLSLILAKAVALAGR